MKKRTQDIQAEISFFDRISQEISDYDTISDTTYKLIFDKISPYFGSDLLEAGCGSGSFGSRIKQRKDNINITGIDINQKFIKLAKKKGVYNNLICANLEDKNIFKKGEFDTIVCPYILHHFPNLEKVTNNIFYWLKPGGYLIIIDPNGSNLVLKTSYFLRLFLSKFVDTTNYASVNESHKSIPNLLKNLKNFRICSIETFENKPRLGLKSSSFSLITILAFSQKILLKIYKFLPFAKFNGSDLIIIAKKNGKT